MTQKEKAKAYDEALERAKKCLDENRDTCFVRPDVIFPELADKDERIRKTLIEYFNTCFGDYYGELKKSDILAWLEKQGEQKPIINVPPREVILAIWDLGNEWKELTNGSISTEYGTQLDYIQKHWHESEYYLREKQGGQKPTDKDMVEALRTEYEKGRADAFAQMQKEWSEEDEKMVANLVDYFKVDDALQYTEKQVVDWLKSLKQKIKGE